MTWLTFSPGWKVTVGVALENMPPNGRARVVSLADDVVGAFGAGVLTASVIDGATAGSGEESDVLSDLFKSDSAVAAAFVLLTESARRNVDVDVPRSALDVDDGADDSSSGEESDVAESDPSDAVESEFATSDVDEEDFDGESAVTEEDFVDGFEVL